LGAIEIVGTAHIVSAGGDTACCLLLFNELYRVIIGKLQPLDLGIFFTCGGVGLTPPDKAVINEKNGFNS
jgi:hypothetical protein